MEDNHGGLPLPLTGGVGAGPRACPPRVLCLLHPNAPLDRCPLPEALRSLLCACAESGSLRDDVLAEHLFQSPQTVHTNFRRINELLCTHERFAAVRMACGKGWIPSIQFAPIIIPLSL